LKRLYIDLGAALAVALVLSFSALGQVSQAAPGPATVMGTVTDVNGDAIPNATVVLKEVEGNDPITIVTTVNGMFEFHDVTPGVTSAQHQLASANWKCSREAIRARTFTAGLGRCCPAVGPDAHGRIERMWRRQVPGCD
jgi:sulfur carrier protein ThiS